MWNFMTARNSARSALWSSIARLADQAPWKTPDQLIVKRDPQPLHELAHGQTLPVFMGTAAVEGIVFWRDGPHIETTTTTETETPWKYGQTLWNFGGSWPAPESEPIVTTTTTTVMFVSFAVAHSFNQFQRPGNLLKVEFDDIVVYDALDDTALPNAFTMRVYDGINNSVDPAMLAKDGAALTPAYHGLRYLFFDEIDLAGFDGKIPASIRIVWGDTAEASNEVSVIPLLATAALGYSFGGRLAYDPELDIFVTVYGNSGDFFIGVTDFAAGEDTSLAQVSNLPAGSWFSISRGCLIPGTGLLLAEVSDGLSDRANLLIDVYSGAVVDSHSDAAHGSVNWLGALALEAESNTYIVAGRFNSSSSVGMPAVFMAVDASTQTLTYLQYGTDAFGNDNAAFPTPGYADATGTTFYYYQSAAIYEAKFTESAAPVWREVYTVPSAETITGFYYDASLDTVTITIQTATDPIRSIAAATGTVVWTAGWGGGSVWRLHPGGGSYNSPADGTQSAITGNPQPGNALLYRISGGSGIVATAVMDLSDGSVTELPLIDAEAADVYNQSTGMVCTRFTDEWRCISATILTPGTVTLAEELTTFSKYDDDRGGLLTDAQVTTEGLAGIVNGGVIIDTDTDLRELASRLAELYGVVKVETATGVKWVLKGKDGSYAPDVVLTEADLAEERRGDAVVKIATRHRNPKEIPAEIEVRYISSDAGYEPMPARAAWPQGVYDTALSLLKRSLSVPVVLTAQQALELAWGLLGRERAADRTHSIKLRPNHLKREPSDVAELTVGGQTIVGQFTKQTKLPDHSLEMTLEGYLSRADTTVTAETPIVHVQPTLSFTTVHVFLDGPLLSQGHDGGGSELIGYSVLTGLEGWQGGSLYRRRAGETNWTKVGEFAGSRPVVGTLTAPLAAAPVTFETDTENELTFDVVYGDADEIVAQTEAQFDAAASVVAVGAPGRWMFLTWRNKTVNGDGTITLDTLRQGLEGTEVHEGTSLTGDRVVLVNASQALLVPYALADLDQNVEMKAVALGVNPNSASATTFTVSGTADTPWAPVNLDAVIAGSDVDLTWDGRSRLGVGEGLLGVDLNVFRVEILDGPGGSVVRTYDDVAGEAQTYPDADITADFGTMPGTLTFRVSQKTSITGIGYGYTAEQSVNLLATASLELESSGLLDLESGGPLTLE